MHDALSYIYNRIIMGRVRCPECGEWCNNTGIDPISLWKDEYYCKQCNTYFYK